MPATAERGGPQRSLLASSAAQGRSLSPIDNFGIGNMKTKTSKESKTYGVRNGMPLNYQFEYEYYDGTHRAEKIGDMHYRYDLNGNVTVERSGGHGTVTGTVEGYWREGDLYGADYGFALARPGSQGGKDAYERRYEWDRRNRLIRTKDPQWTVDYRYGYDGQRRLKYAQENRNETAYFNNMWQTSASANNRDWLQSKHIFVGESRIATKSNREVWESGTDNNLGFEINNQYWYHGDHLGSAQVVTERGGSLLERIEYMPYGEIWVEHKYDAAESSLPYRFTGKELDPETNFYYFGARYLDPRTSRWLSTDPAMGDYIPSAGMGEENLPGLGGVYNTINLHSYHYSFNNPIKYIDPNGETATYSVDEENKTINIDLDIVIYGKDASSDLAQEYKDRIMEQWGQDVDGNQWQMDIGGEQYSVNFNVNVTVGHKPGLLRKLWNALFGTRNFINVDNKFERPNVILGSFGTWIGSGTPQRYGLPFTKDNIPAHEAGHLLGLKDRYKDNSSGISAANPGWEGNLMATTFGNVDQRNINVIGERISGRSGNGKLRSILMRH